MRGPCRQHSLFVGSEIFVCCQFHLKFVLQLAVCVLAVMVTDSGVMGQGMNYYRNNYRSAVPYRSSKNIQPVSNSLGGGRNYYNTYNPYKSYDPYSAMKRPVQQYKWKLDFDYYIEDMSDSNESVEVYRYMPYRIF